MGAEHVAFVRFHHPLSHGLIVRLSSVVNLYGLSKLVDLLSMLRDRWRLLLMPP